MTQSSAFRLVTLSVLILGAIGLAHAPAVAADGPAAVLTVVAGDVSIVRSGDVLSGEFGATLQSGDVVKTGGDAQAAVFFSSGQVIELGPNSSITVGGLPTEGSQGDVASSEVGQAEDLSLFAQTESSQEGLSALPTLRAAGGSELVAVSPRQTRVRPGTMTFEWSPVEDVLEYKLVLVGPGAAAGEHSADDNVWDLPPDMAFRFGESWTWHVVAITMDGELESLPVTLEVADEKSVGGLDGFQERMQPLLGAESPKQNDTALYLLGSYARSAGFYEDAIEHLSTLVQRHPQRKELHRELGYLYQAIGRNDRAAEEYRRALEE